METSSFGSESIMLKVKTEMTKGLHYKLRVLGLPIDVPVENSCDKDSVVIKLSVTKLVLSYKHSSICYHRVWKAHKTVTIWVGWI